MWPYVLTAVVAIALAFVVFVATRPSEFRIARRMRTAAPASAVFAHVNDFRNWRAWSPWENVDPQLKRTYEGASAGVGATYSWAGNKNAGEGRMTITESRPGQCVRIRLEFLKPFKATNTAEFDFEPEGDYTNVTWNMTGKRNFLFKAVGLCMDMDKIVGAQFEEGLRNLKGVVEGTPLKV